MTKKRLMLPALSGLLLSTALLSPVALAEENLTSLAPESSVTLPMLEVPAAELDGESAEPVTSAGEAIPLEEELVAEGLPHEVGEVDKEHYFNIIHTNDIHGRIEEGRDVIGMAKLATVVEMARQEAPTLVLDAGDAFQGLPISNSTKGEDMADIMNAIGYDAMAVGNHEFDFSLEQAQRLKEILNFPLLSANTYVNDARLFEAATIIDKTPDIEGDEFVVIGVTTPETSTKTHPNNVAGVVFRDPITEVNQVISEIEAKGRAMGRSFNHYVILAHLGIDATTPVEWQGSTLAQALADNPELAGKRVIVLDGHSHTVNTAVYGDNTLYSQTGSYLNNVGLVRLTAPSVTGSVLLGQSIKDNVAADPAIAERVADIKARYEAENAVVVLDNNPIEFNGDRENVRVRETNLGNLVADALYEYGQTGFGNKTDLAVMNGGGLRATIAKDQPVTKGDIIAVLPFGNSISQIEVTGQQIKDMFIKSLGSTHQTKDGQPVLDANGNPLLEASGGFLHTAGAYVLYDTNLPAEERILGIQIYDRATDSYQDLDLEKTYYLATNDFLAAGGDGYTMLGGAREEGPSLDGVLSDYLQTFELTIEDYGAINPISRLISISKDLDSDGDGSPDYLELLAMTDLENPDEYPGKVLTPPTSDQEASPASPGQTQATTGQKPSAPAQSGAAKVDLLSNQSAGQVATLGQGALIQPAQPVLARTSGQARALSSHKPVLSAATSAQAITSVGSRSSKSSQTLPQTGEASSVLGLAGLSVLGLVTGLVNRRRQD